MSKSKRVLIIIIAVLFVAAVIAVFWFFSEEQQNDDPIEPTAQATEETQAQTEAPTQSRENQLLESMSLQEKVAQMIMVSCHEGIDIESAVNSDVGGICLYTHSFADKTEDGVISMIEGYQNISKIPLLVSTDEEGGTVNRVSLNENLRAVPFWSPSELFNEGGYELIKSDTEEKADLLLSLGINVNLAPVCDVPLDEDNYIYDRCFSLSHDETAQYVSTVVNVMKEKGIGSTLKHFPGYGGSVDTHESMSHDNRDYSAFENGDFKPFIAGINAGADCVLVSHNIVTCMDPDMPASLSQPIHEILRNELSFSGVIMTDDLVMQGVAQFTDGENAAVLAVKAGNDMIICEDYNSAINAIVAAVNNGEIDEAQIDQSVLRVLRWKESIGLLN